MRPTVTKTIIDAVSRSGLICPGSSVLCAVSGGADSMCLLHVLFSNREAYGISVYAAHYNHSLRGEDLSGTVLLSRITAGNTAFRCVSGKEMLQHLPTLMLSGSRKRPELCGMLFWRRQLQLSVVRS